MRTPVQISPASAGTTSTQGTSVSGGGSAGAYTTTKVQLVSSTDTDYAGLWAVMSEGATVGSLFKLYTGGSGSETEFAELVGSSSAYYHCSVFVPIHIPSGTRISAAKADSDGFGATARIHIVPVRGESYGPLVSRGRLIGASSGALTNVDAGATANTKGSWVELSASTTNDARGFTICAWGDASCDTAVRHHMDVGIGAAGSEQIILADIGVSQLSFRAEMIGFPVGPFWTPIPAGSRVAIRTQCSSASANSRIPRLGLILWE